MTILRLSLGAMLACVLLAWRPAPAAQDAAPAPVSQTAEADPSPSKEAAAPKYHCGSGARTSPLQFTVKQPISRRAVGKAGEMMFGA